LVARKVLGDGGVIGGSVREGLEGEPSPQLDRCPAGSYRPDQLRITLGSHHNGHGAPVLGRGPDQRHSADIDVLDELILSEALRQRVREGIEVDDDEIDGRDV
jgi:hypothetical protein